MDVLKPQSFLCSTIYIFMSPSYDRLSLAVRSVNMLRVRTSSSACIIFALLFVLGSFSDMVDMKIGTAWITRQSAYAQEVAKDNESNQTPFVGVNMRGYYTN